MTDNTPKSHIGHPLETHLHQVADRAEHVHATRTPEEQTAIRTVGLMHDFGKATEYFQTYLHTKQKPDSDPKLKNHSFIGGYATYYILREHGLSPEFCVSGFLAVAKHHSRLPNLSTYIRNQTQFQNQLLPQDTVLGSRVKKQANSIQETANRFAESIFQDTIGEGGSFEAFKSELESDDLADSLKKDASNADTDVVYRTTLQLWSALTLADKTLATEPDADLPERSALNLSDLEAEVERLQAESDADGWRGSLNESRETARTTVLEECDAFYSSEMNVATLSLPTGLGKTFTGLGAALKLQSMKQSEPDVDSSTVVYALPFTSIIDQTKHTIEDVFNVGSEDGTAFTTHHHLSDSSISYETDSGESVDSDLEMMLGESWRCGTVLTTFVQLFESLTSPKNTQGMKLPSLYDSVVVLDEPQAIPQSWWGLVTELIQILTGEYNATVVSMTATQPTLFAGNGMDTYSLLDSPESYYTEFERVEYQIDDSVTAYHRNRRSDGKQHTDAAEQITESVTGESNTSDADSALVVCNTIRSAETLFSTITQQYADSGANTISVYDVYQTLKDTPTDNPEEMGMVEAVTSAVKSRVTESDGVAVAYLSSRLTPNHRELIVSVADNLSTDIPFVLVSTQVVEAGVDVSFQQVYRDLAPMDSMVQAAGRCNRSFEWGEKGGTVVLWRLSHPTDPEMYEPSKAVYELENSQDVLKITVDALFKVADRLDRVSESVIAWDAVTEYYSVFENRNVGDMSLVSNLTAGEWLDLGEESLIQGSDSADVYVIQTEVEQEQYQQLVEGIAQEEWGIVSDARDSLANVRVSVSETSTMEPVFNQLTEIGVSDSKYDWVEYAVDSEVSEGLYGEFGISTMNS